MIIDSEKKRNLTLIGLKPLAESVEPLKEERITNKEASGYVERKKNFVGSHTYGEDLGDKGGMYVAYSYGEQHPLYLWDSSQDKWFYNSDDYVLPDGKANVWTRKHLKDLRPNFKIHGIPKSLMLKKISVFKQQNNLGDNVHTDLEPGEK